jgi:uncharacterized membrane protein
VAVVARKAARKPAKKAARVGLEFGARRIAKRLPAPTDALHALVRRARKLGALAEGESVRSVPIQCSVDVAVPLEVAYDEWMALEFLPEGAHRIVEIERDGEDVLLGRLTGTGRSADWEAEIRDERVDESFAWRSVAGSDCAGLITFHRLGQRLTRLELELDVVPVRLSEAALLMLRIADRRARTDLRCFKARVERISPDDYPRLDEETGSQTDDDEEKE